MTFISKIVGFAVLCTCAPGAFANDPAVEAFRAAQQLADCAKALDAACVIDLSDAASYERLAPPAMQFHFAQSQSRFYAAMKRNGWRYIRFDTYAPSAMFSGDDRLYAFVPYIDTLEIPGQPPDEVRAFFIAISEDGGNSWKFVDGEGITPEYLTKIIPSYGGQPLPVVRTTHFQ